MIRRLSAIKVIFNSKIRSVLLIYNLGHDHVKILMVKFKLKILE